MERRQAMLTCLLFLHVAHQGSLASVGEQHGGGTHGDQVGDGSSWVPYVWDVAREGRHYGPVLPLARPRQRHDNDEPELLYAVWESPPILAKEGLTEEEAGWVPDDKPLQTIKENYVFGSRDFDHHFAYVPHSVHHSTPHTTHPPPPPPPPYEIPTPHTEPATPDTPSPAPHTDTPTPYTDTTTPYTPIHPHPIPSHHQQPFNFVLPLRRRPRKYFLAGGEDKDKHEDVPSHSGPFRKYYIDPASKGGTQDTPYTPPSHEQPIHPHYFPDLPPVYPHPHYPRPPPTVRQYFLQRPADKEPHVTNLTSFEVYDKLRKTRTVDTLVETEARTWVVSGVPKATSWVSSSSGHRHS